MIFHKILNFLKIFLKILDQILKLILVAPVIITNLWKKIWNFYDPPP